MTAATLRATLLSLGALCACGSPEATTRDEIVSAGPNGLQIEGPFTHDALDVWLVRGAEQAPLQHRTIPLEAALEQDLVVVHETGEVGELAIENKSPDTAVYVQSGDIVQGGKQDRTIRVDLVLQPGSGRVPLPSFCVEQGRWSVRGGAAPGPDLRLAGATASTFDLSQNAVSTKELKKAVLLAGEQEEVWQEVANAQTLLTENASAFGAVVDPSSPTSLELTMNSEGVRRSTAACTAALGDLAERHPDAIGFVFAVHGELQSADVYGSRALFAQCWPKLLRSAATAAVAAPRPTTEAPAPDAEQVLAMLTTDEPAERRQVGGDVTMGIGEGPRSHVVESRAGDALLHRTYLAR